MSCTFYKWDSGFFFGDYYCTKQNKAVDSETYSKYCRDYNYSECPIYKHQESSGCFITTVVCDILGTKDNDKTLETLRNFRDNVLQKNKKYYHLLKLYDNMGPKIADAILHDSDNRKLSTFLFNDIIKPISKQIEQKNYDRAINNYELMMLSLINYYGFKHDYNNAVDRDYNYQEKEFNPRLSGHGRRRLKTQEG